MTSATIYLSPMIAAALGLYAYARWLWLTAEDKAEVTSLEAFVPEVEDVRRTELALPEMSRR